MAVSWKVKILQVKQHSCESLILRYIFHSEKSEKNIIDQVVKSINNEIKIPKFFKEGQNEN